MPILDKLLGIASVGGSVANYAMMQRFLTGIAGLVIFAIISALMTAALLVGAFVALYFLLVSYGLTSTAAALLVAGLLIMATAIMIMMTVMHLRHLREMTHYSLNRDVPGVARITSILDAFLEGFNGARTAQRKS